MEELAGFFADGLGRENPEERALALAGVMRLALWMPGFARSRFGLGEIEYSAARALVVHMDVPPEPLLEHVMELIRGPEYFCDGNLTQFIPKFGDSAVPYLEELRELRVVLLNRIGTPARNAAGGILGEFELRMIDRAISSLEN